MLNRIITNIIRLRGVEGACIYKMGETLATSFAEDTQDKINNTMDVFEQIFSGLEAIGKSHNEVYFSLEDKLIAVFKLHDEHYAVLLIEKKVNFPLIKIGLKSASEQIKQKVQKNHLKQQQSHPQEQATNHSTIPTSPEIAKVLEQYSTVLTLFMGPAARFIVEDCATEWKKKYIQNTDNLEFLLALIQDELSNNEEKQRFMQQIELIVKLPTQ